VGEQTEVILRCGECRRLRPDQKPTAIGKLLRTPEGRWQAYRMVRSPVPLQPISLGTWKLGDHRFVLAKDNEGTLESLWVYATGINMDARTIELPCRGCQRAPARVRAPKVGGRALAQGLTEVDV
jgi:hypothetical protein